MGLGNQMTGLQRKHLEAWLAVVSLYLLVGFCHTYFGMKLKAGNEVKCIETKNQVVSALAFVST
jgi:hypothetical protein